MYNLRSSTNLFCVGTNIVGDMEVRWTSITLLLVTLVVKVHCYPEDHAQSSETTGEHKSITRKDSPLQQNVFSNAEFKVNIMC
ncbi:hypothetical protein E2C01_052912 [Portunus trituberculatus]|uniref:Uncharacterized protein n=1 Tax=Portunus trituberculatus TaxID=210409 RepID=A0A5B7GFT0_PORTR|nr:hypothetical protein [Portunus trituberculatus]